MSKGILSHRFGNAIHLPSTSGLLTTAIIDDMMARATPEFKACVAAGVEVVHLTEEKDGKTFFTLKTKHGVNRPAMKTVS